MFRARLPQERAHALLVTLLAQNAPLSQMPVASPKASMSLASIASYLQTLDAAPWTSCRLWVALCAPRREKNAAMLLSRSSMMKMLPPKTFSTLNHSKKSFQPSARLLRMMNALSNTSVLSRKAGKRPLAGSLLISMSVSPKISISLNLFAKSNSSAGIGLLNYLGGRSKRRVHLSIV